MYYGTPDNINYGFYLDKGNLKSSVDVTDADYKALFDGQASGKAISHDDSGNPVLVDPLSLLTVEQKQKSADLKVTSLINAVYWRVQRYESQTALGTKTTDSAENYKAILQYIQNLREVNHQDAYTSAPENITWPTLDI